MGALVRPPTCDATAFTTASTCSSASSAYIGKDKTSVATRSDTGRSPGSNPRSEYAGCRCTGTG